MGHTRESTFDAYYSHTVNLDTQSGFLNEPLQHELLTRANGMRAHRDLRAPDPPCSSLGRWTQSPDQGSSGVRKTRRKFYNAFERQSWTWHREQAGTDILAQLAVPETGPQSSDPVAQDGQDRSRPSRLLRAILRYHTARAQVIDTLFPANGSKNHDLIPAIECLYQFLQEREQLCVYADVSSPVDGRCPYCGQLFTVINTKVQFKINKHLLECHLFKMLCDEISRNDFQRACMWAGCPKFLKGFPPEEIIEHNSHHLIELFDQSLPLRCRWRSCRHRSPDVRALLNHLRQQHSFYCLETAPEINFCHECAEWFRCRLDWEQHCQDHLDRLDMFCGRVTWRSHLVIPSNCPFCLGSSNLRPSVRYRQFSRTDQLVSHIRVHHAKKDL